MRTTLFRHAALESQNTRWLGEILLIRPLPQSVMAGLAVAAACAFAAVLIFGSHTRRTTVAAQLVPDKGLIKVYAPQPGVVTQKRFVEGQRVERGSVLYVLSNERLSTTQGDAHESISRQVEARRRSMQDELAQTRELQRREEAALQRRLDGLRGELAALDSQLEGQRQRARLAHELARRYEGLLAQDYVSQEQAQQKRDEALEQQTRLHALERDRITLRRELAAQQAESGGLPLRQQNQIAALERGIAGIAQELTESEIRRELAVTAPARGIVTAGLAEPGQAVGSGTPVVSIVPEDAVLQAHLDVPSRAIGFVRPGDQVVLRYPAYPYQKFGSHRAVVASVARTALMPSEIQGAAPPREGAGEPVYRVVANLVSQAVAVNGKPLPLQAGMAVEADLMHETRRLYEWLLSPLQAGGR